MQFVKACTLWSDFIELNVLYALQFLVKFFQILSKMKSIWNFVPKMSEVKVHSLLGFCRRMYYILVSDVSGVVHALDGLCSSLYYLDHVYTEVCKNWHFIGQAAGLPFKWRMRICF